MDAHDRRSQRPAQSALQPVLRAAVALFSRHARIRTALCHVLAEPTESEPGQANEQRDAAILASLPANGRIVLARCSQRDGKPSSDETITPCGPFVALRRSPGAPARAVSLRDDSPVIQGSRMPFTTGHALPWQHDPRSRAKCTALPLRGHSPRSVGDRLLKVACAMPREGPQFHIGSPKNAC